MTNNYKELIQEALSVYDGSSPRTQQSLDGILGPSDIGFCRQKAVLVTRQVPPSDKTPMWAANVGTAIHSYVELALKTIYPNWLMGSIDHIKVEAHLPSGAKISGHPDIVIPSSNTVLDIKTVNGFEWTKRHGPSQSHKYQRHLYAMGLMREDILDPTQPVYVGNIYFDRSGKEQEPIVFCELFAPSLTSEIDRWVSDVIYAVQNGEDSARDVAAAVCEQICNFFTVCRGGLPERDNQEVITDDYLLSAIDMYIAGRELENEGKQMKKESGEKLAGINGITATHQIRWVTVGASKVESFDRPGHERMDVRKRRI